MKVGKFDRVKRKLISGFSLRKINLGDDRPWCVQVDFKKELIGNSSPLLIVSAFHSEEEALVERDRLIRNLQRKNTE